MLLLGLIIVRTVPRLRVTSIIKRSPIGTSTPRHPKAPKSEHNNQQNTTGKLSHWCSWGANLSEAAMTSSKL